MLYATEVHSEPPTFTLVKKQLTDWVNSLADEAKNNGWRAQRRILTLLLANSPKLDLSNLALPSLPCSCLCSLQNLLSIDLSGNRLTTLEGNGIDKLEKLEHLDLSSNLLTEIRGIERLHNLRTLNLANNQGLCDLRGLLNFPSELLQSVIEHAIMDRKTYSGEKVALIKIKAALRDRAEELDLSRLNLIRVPPQIQFLQQLKRLDISHNHLANLAGIKTLGALNEVNAANNILMGNHPSILELRSLHLLNTRPRISRTPFMVRRLPRGGSPLPWLSSARNLQSVDRLTSTLHSMGADVESLGEISSLSLANCPLPTMLLAPFAAWVAS